MKFNNSKSRSFISKLPLSGLEDSNISERSKFNFSYFIGDQDAGQKFEEWEGGVGASTLLSMIKKVQEYTREPLKYWEHQSVGRQNILEIYGDFPQSKSDFEHPPCVPHDVLWSRFRLAAKVRLIGFIIPERFHGLKNTLNGKDYFLDSNTFYVVFLDKEHKFYKTEAR
jgi:hypothetical protein